MSLNGRYSIGIILTFVLLAVSMLYSIPLINLFFKYKTLTTDLFFYNRLSLWLILILVLTYNFLIENRSFFVWEEKKHSPLFYLGAIVALYFISLFGGAFLNGIISLITQEKVSERLLELKILFKNNYFLIIFIFLTAYFI